MSNSVTADERMLQFVLEVHGNLGAMIEVILLDEWTLQIVLDVHCRVPWLPIAKEDSSTR
jgi:hypothetical protein